ncbi:MAG: hypothetical protein V4710_13625 [Verrucomicrobiota bacterium]
MKETILFLAQCFACFGIGVAGVGIGLFFLLRSPGLVSDTHDEPENIHY